MSSEKWVKSSYCQSDGCVEVAFRRASGCNADGCVEVGGDGDRVVFRDSKLGDDSPILAMDPTDARWHFSLIAEGFPGNLLRDALLQKGMRFDDAEWLVFCAGVGKGDFDFLFETVAAA